MTLQSGRFQLPDGGFYVGDVDLDGTANGFGVTRGRTGNEAFAGFWTSGFGQSGVYSSSPAGQLLRYEGQWSDGRKNGFGVETRGGWIYRGEWLNGFKGRYGVRESLRTSAKFEGTWSNGLQDGYGVERYADGGVYQGQWLNGLRHGYGIRQSATYAETTHSHEQFRAAEQHQSASRSAGNFDLNSALDSRDQRIEIGGGFVLTEDVALDGSRRKFWTSVGRIGGSSSGFSRTFFGGLRKAERRRRSAEGRGIDEGQTHDDTRPNPGAQGTTPPRYSNLGPGDDDSWSIGDRVQVPEGGSTETYSGEWRQDRRCGFGVCQRSDGLKYEGEWVNNKKAGYGRTTLPDGSRLEGKYRNNVLVSSVGKSGRGPRFLSMSLGEKVENAVREAQSAAENAKQKADISSVRAVTAREKAEESTAVALDAVRNAEMALHKSSQLNQQEAQQGENLKLHRVDETIFLLEYDTSSVTMTTPGATKRTKFSSSSLGFQRPTQTVHDFDADKARKSAPAKWFSFPRRKPRTAENIRTDIRHLEPGNQPQQQQQQLHPPLESMDEESNVERGLEEHLSGLMDPDHLVVPGVQGPELGGMKRQQVPVPRLNTPLSQVDEKLIGEKIRRELLEATEPKQAMYPRRNSLPSIVKETILPATSSPPPPSPSPPSPPPTSPSPLTNIGTRKPESGVQPVPPSPPPPPVRRETYVIERGVRKRVKNLYEDVEQVQRSPSGAGRRKVAAATPSFRSPGAMGKLIMSTMVTGFALSQSTPLRDWTTDDDDKFRKMYALEAPAAHRKSKTGSASDVSAIGPSEMMSREQVYAMSQRKREEIIQRRAEEERRRRGGEIVISLSGLLDCRLFPVFIVVVVIASVVFFLIRFGFVGSSSSH